MQHRLDEHEVDELTTAYRDGATIEQLAAQFFIHRTTVMSHLDRREVPRRHGGLNPNEFDQVADLYQAGWSLARLARRFLVDDETVRRRLVKTNVRIRLRGRPAAPSVKHISG